MNLGSESNPLKHYGASVAYATPGSSFSTEEGAFEVREDLNSGDKIGTLRFHRSGSTVDIPVYPTTISRDAGVESNLRVRANGQEGFAPIVERDSAAYPFLSIDHDGAIHGFHDSTTLPDKTSPSDTRIAYGGTDNKTYIEAADGTLLYQFTEATSSVFRADINADYAAYGSFDENVYVHDLSDGSLVYTLTLASSAVGKLSLSDAYVIYAGNQENDAYVHDLSDGSLKYTLSQASNDISGVSAGSSYLAYGAKGVYGTVYIHDAADGSLYKSTSDGGGPNDMAVNDTYVAYGDDLNNSAYVWDIDSGSLKYTLTQASDSVKAVGLSSSYVAYGGYDNNVYVHDLADGSLLYTLTESNDRVQAISLTDSYVSYGGNDTNVYVNNLPDGGLSAKLNESAERVYGVGAYTDTTGSAIPDAALNQDNWQAGVDVGTLSYTLGSDTLDITSGVPDGGFLTGGASFVDGEVNTSNKIYLECDVANDSGSSGSYDFALALCEQSDGSNLIYGAGGKFNVNADSTARIYDFTTEDFFNGDSLTVNTGELYSLRVEITTSGEVTYFIDSTQVNTQTFSSFDMENSYIGLYFQSGGFPDVDLFKNFKFGVV